MDGKTPRFRIAQVATAKGMSVRDLERAILMRGENITYATLHALWHGKTDGADYDTIRKIAEALGVPLRELDSRAA